MWVLSFIAEARDYIHHWVRSQPVGRGFEFRVVLIRLESLV